MRTLVDLKAERARLDAELDAALVALTEAIGTGDDDAIVTTADAAEAAEAAVKALDAREYQQAKYLERCRVKFAKDERAIDALIESGMNAEDARAQVTGVDVDKQRRRDFLAMVRDNGITAVGFDDAVKQWHAYTLVELWDTLESQTRGVRLVNKRAHRLGISHTEFFYSSVEFVRKHAAEEMLDWFDQYGRFTRARVREQALGLPRAPEPYWHR